MSRQENPKLCHPNKMDWFLTSVKATQKKFFFQQTVLKQLAIHNPKKERKKPKNAQKLTLHGP
jgi:hypothetical protein